MISGRANKMYSILDVFEREKGKRVWLRRFGGEG
jgi:hypothetical protein